jgi:hypothetical protein
VVVGTNFLLRKRILLGTSIPPATTTKTQKKIIIILIRAIFLSVFRRWRNMSDQSFKVHCGIGNLLDLCIPLSSLFCVFLPCFFFLLIVCVFVENNACYKLVQSVLGSGCSRLMNFFTHKIKDLMMHKRAHKEERRGARGRDEERSNQEEWVSKEEGEKERDREIIHTLPEALSMMPSSVSGTTSMRRGGGRGTPMRVVVS